MAFFGACATHKVQPSPGDGGALSSSVACPPLTQHTWSGSPLIRNRPSHSALLFAQMHHAQMEASQWHEARCMRSASVTGKRSHLVAAVSPDGGEAAIGTTRGALWLWEHRSGLAPRGALRLWEHRCCQPTCDVQADKLAQRTTYLFMACGRTSLV